MIIWVIIKSMSLPTSCTSYLESLHFTESGSSKEYRMAHEYKVASKKREEKITNLLSSLTLEFGASSSVHYNSISSSFVCFILLDLHLVYLRVMGLK